MNNLRKIVCAMSGGVDSSVAALILKRKGFCVEGVFMKNWDMVDETGLCSQDRDLADAHYVCKKLNIPLREVNFVKEYWNEVFSEMIDGYRKGTTPNPDVLCNRHVKFGALFRHATEEMGGDALATGHYCRSSYGQFLQHKDTNKGAYLLTGVDPIKDQTLFLAQMSQNALQRTIFPVGGLFKTKVKAMATEGGLQRICKKKESMGICFIGSRNFHHFIEEYITPCPGNFVDVETGLVVGQHKGTHYWTLGQRIHLGGLAAAYFVQRLDVTSQNVWVASGTHHPSLYTQSFHAERPHWIHSPPEEFVENGCLQCSFKFQHIDPLIQCSIQVNSSGDSSGEEGRGEEWRCRKENRLIGGGGGKKEGDGRGAGARRNSTESEGQERNNQATTIHVKLQRPLRAITPGQYACFYEGDICLGSARILNPGPSLWELRENNVPLQNKKHFYGVRYDQVSGNE